MSLILLLAAAQQAPAADPPLDDIVVTARRRSEELQRVPVSVVSLPAKELEERSVTNLRALQRFVPNLTFAPSQNVGEAASNIFIRGIGQEDFVLGAEPGVGLYVDGVYFARSFGTMMNLLDVARIEVLRGPQGTLYGKNSIGGAINLISIQPQAGRERQSSLILGNLDRVEVRSTINEPLTDRFFARLSLSAVTRGGHLSRLDPPASTAALQSANQALVDLGREGGERSLAARLQLRWLVSDTLIADFAIDGTRRRGNQGATHLDALDVTKGVFPVLNLRIAQGELPGPPITEDFVTGDLLESYATGRNKVRQDLWGGSVRVAKSFGADTLTLTGAYRALDSVIGTDTDGLWFDITEVEASGSQWQLSGEAQLVGSRGPLSYTAGLFLFDETAKLRPGSGILGRIRFTCGCIFPPTAYQNVVTYRRRLQSSSYAAYAQATYRLTDKLSAHAGARLSLERKSIKGVALQVDPDLEPTDEVAAEGRNKGKWRPFTWRAGGEYQSSPDLMLYASVAKGYKSGGFNIRADRNLPNLGFADFAPEKALTFEGGVRSRWLGQRLRFNATIFHTTYRDIQLRQQHVVDGNVTTLIENAAKARIRGAEVELALSPTPGLRLSGAYGYLKPRYLDVGEVPGLTLGSRFQRTPSHSVTASANFEARLGKGLLELHADYSYRSKEQFQILEAVNDQEGYGLLDARATYRFADGRWALALFGTNLTDRRYRTAGRGTLIGEVGIAYSSVGLPRQFGVELTSRF